MAIKDSINIDGFIFRKHLFWDVPNKKINKGNASLIIERIITRGNLDELMGILNIFDFGLIISETLKIKNLDKKTLNYIHILNSILVKK